MQMTLILLNPSDKVKKTHTLISLHYALQKHYLTWKINILLKIIIVACHPR